VGIRLSNRTEVITAQDALAWIAEIFEEPPTSISRATRRADIAGWDSLGQLVLMSGLDQRFGIRLTPAELSSLTSVEDLLRILRDHACLIEERP
jgi:acyl carrier protein